LVTVMPTALLPEAGAGDTVPEIVISAEPEYADLSVDTDIVPAAVANAGERMSSVAMSAAVIALSDFMVPPCLDGEGDSVGW